MPIRRQRIYYVNSEQRLAGVSHNFTYRLDLPPDNEYTHVSLLQASIPTSFYLIRSGYNTFGFEDSGGAQTLTIEPGNYNVNSFAAHLEELLTAASTTASTYTISFNKVTNKYTYTGHASTILTFTGSIIASHFGFESTSTNTFTAGVLVSPICVNFVSTSTIYLHSDICNDSTSILQEIYVGNTQPFTHATWLCPHPRDYGKPLANKHSTVFNFSVCDEDDLPLDLNGGHVCLSLLLYANSDGKIESEKIIPPEQ